MQNFGDAILAVNNTIIESVIQKNVKMYEAMYWDTEDPQCAWLFHWNNYYSRTPHISDIPRVKYLWDAFNHIGNDKRVLSLFENEGFCRQHAITPQQLKIQVLPKIQDSTLAYHLVHHIGINFYSTTLVRASFSGSCLENDINGICQLYDEELIDRDTWMSLIKQKSCSKAPEEVEIYVC